MAYSFIVIAILLLNGGLAWFGGTPDCPLLEFVVYATAHLLLYTLLFSIIPRDDNTPAEDDPKADDWSTRSPHKFLSLGPILVTGILLRILFIAYPMSSDVNRYAWDGMIQVDGINPYLTTPGDLYDRASASDPIFRGIDHHQIAAIDPPLALLLFRGVAEFHSAAGYAPDALLTTYKLFFVLADIAILILLARLLKRWRKPVYWLCLYAWNPFVLIFGAGECHLELWVTGFIVAALLNFHGNGRSAILGYLLLGCSVMVQYVSIIVLPFVVNRTNRRYLPFLLLPTITFLPFCAPGIFQDLFTFLQVTHYNELLPKFFRPWLPGSSYPIAVVTIFLIGLFLIWFLKQTSNNQTIRLAWMWLIFCLPTVHPWCLLPLIPFLLYKPNRAWFLLTILMGLQFWAAQYKIDSGEWHDIGWIWYATYLPFLVVLAAEFYSKRALSASRYPYPRSIDIVVPTYNENSRIRDKIDNLQRAVMYLGDLKDADCDSNIYFVDGGSDDGTPETLEQSGMTVTRTTRPSRGQQFATGINAGEGDIILMLHADSIIAEDALVRLHQAFRNCRTLQWGILGHSYDKRPLKMKIIELSNRLRFGYLGLAFGDQGIFVRRSVLEAVGGMPTCRLMEDVELSIRLGECPNRRNLGGLLTVSTRRWIDKKFSGYTLQVLKLVSTYLILRRLGSDVYRLSDKMYEQYYGVPAASAT